MKKGRKAILCLLMAAVFIMPITAGIANSEERDVISTAKTSENGWYYLPGYPNYAPNGMPDFYQIQERWIGFCGPTAVANAFWYIDSKYADPNGYPGDGIDIFPLVEDYHAPSTPEPGPNTDDHNFNNVNDLATPWEWGSTSPEGYELIERLAVYMGTDRDGTDTGRMYSGIMKWLRDTDLDKWVIVKNYGKPSFEFVAEAVMQEKCVILIYGLYDSQCNRMFGHGVTVAGVNINESKIAISDPFDDESIPNNDASIVQHDIHSVNLNPPCQRGTWAIDTDKEVENAIIIYVEEKADLVCHGNISWADIKPSDTVVGSFTVENVGFPSSELDWEISAYPDWGTWTFRPSSGEGLKNEDGPVTVAVEVVAPDDSNQEFSGEIKVVNKANPDDFGTVLVSLATPLSKNSLLFEFFEMLIQQFPLLERIFSLYIFQ